jgi:LysM repeat protein
MVYLVIIPLMDSIPLEANQAISAAAKALRSGDKENARHLAWQAAQLAPHLEYAWLILAEVTDSPARIDYLKKAIVINPGRASTHKQFQVSREKMGLPATAFSRAISEPGEPLDLTGLDISKRVFDFPVVLVSVILAILIIFGGWGNNIPLAFAAILPISQAENGLLPNSWSEVNILKPTRTLTATVTSTPTPTATITPSSTATATPLPNATITPIPTSTNPPAPLPTRQITNPVSPTQVQLTGDEYVVQAGDTLFKISQWFGVSLADLAAANSISTGATIYVGQHLVIPEPGFVAINTPVPEELQPETTTDKYILVDISEQHMYVYESGTLVFSFVASTGMNNATRVGVFSVLDKIPNAYGATWDLWMPNWLGIYYAGSLENGIHALPILSNGVRLWAGYLGTPISFGCIVLGVSEAQQLYDWVDVGTPVEIQW